MSNKRLRGAQALIEEMGAALPAAEKAANEPTAQEGKEPSQSISAVPTDLDRREKEKLSTTVAPSTKLAITLIQEDALRRGWKKPKIGEILDEAVLLLLKQRGLSLK